MHTSIMWCSKLLFTLLHVNAIVLRGCLGFSQGSAIVQAFESSYCESGLDDMVRGPLHYDMVSCGGVCRADVAPRNMYALRANHTHYSANNNLTLTLRANSRVGANILGFVIVAISESGMTAGRWMVDENDEEPEVLRATCDSLLEGQVIFHAHASSTRTTVEVIWNPRSTNYGRIIFRAWVVQRHDSIYTVDSEPLTNPLDGARYMSVQRRFASIIGNILSKADTNTSTLPLQQQSNGGQRDVQASTSRRTPKINSTNNNDNNHNPAHSSFTTTTPIASPTTSSRQSLPSPVSTVLPFESSFTNAQTQPALQTSAASSSVNSTAEFEDSRKRLPINILRSVRNRLTPNRHKLAIPAKEFNSNGTVVSSEMKNLEESAQLRENSTIPLLSIPTGPTLTQDNKPTAPNVISTLQTHTLQDENISSPSDSRLTNPAPGLIPITQTNTSPLRHSLSSPMPSLMEHFENDFQSRLTTGYNLTVDDPFRNFNAISFSLNDFFPAESIPGLLDAMALRESRTGPMNQLEGNGTDDSLISRNSTRESETQPNRNSTRPRPTITRVITPAGNSGSRLPSPTIQSPLTSNPRPPEGLGSDPMGNQFIQQPNFQRQLQWQQQQQQQQQQQNQNNFNYFNFPWMNPMRNFQNLPSFQNPTSFQQVQPQPNQWLVNDNQPFFSMSPNRQNMASNSNNFIGHFPNADQLLGRTFPSSNLNNVQTMSNLNNNNNNRFLNNGLSNQSPNNINNNMINNNVDRNLALQNQIRMFLANRNQAMTPQSSQSMNPSPQRGFAQAGRGFPASNSNSNNNDPISFNWFG